MLCLLSFALGDCDRLVEEAWVGVSVREFTTPEYRRAALQLHGLLADPARRGRARRVAEAERALTEGVRRYGALYRQLLARGAAPA